MGKKDSRIDSYIAKQADFAKPILEYIRDVIHEGCPEVVETIKWSAPAFEYQGILCNMAGFKQHVGWGFWKGTLIVTPSAKSLEAAGSFGRITSIDDLPPRKQLLGYVKQAMSLNESGAKAPTKRTAPKKAIAMPADLKAALTKNKKAKTTFDAFSPSHKREYLEWITEAKQEETRKRRVAQALEWMAEGKPRMWKYMR